LRSVTTPTRKVLARAPNLLTQVQTIPLDSVEGRIDHFGLDAKGRRLFVSALGNDTVEVVDVTAGKVTQHRNLRAPQGIGFAADSNRLAVANDQDGSCRLYDARRCSRPRRSS
jgi:DNA-binding beta-propeller fold protein YncE